MIRRAVGEAPLRRKRDPRLTVAKKAPYTSIQLHRPMRSVAFRPEAAEETRLAPFVR